MGMQQPSPEILQQLMQQGGGQDPSQDPSQGGGFDPNDPNAAPQDPAMAQDGGAMTGGHPDAPAPEIAPQQIDPMMMLEEVIGAYMNYALSIVSDHTLDKPVQSKILLEQAQAMNSLVSLIHNNPENPANQQGQDPAVIQQEMEQKAAQHQQDLQMKAAIHDQQMQIQTEKHQMDMAKMQHDMQMAVAQHQLKQAEHHQSLQHKENEHKQKLVHDKNAAEAKIKQQKQAAQSKPSSKQGK